MQKLSVIIPAYNRHPLTIRHVEECMRSTRLPDEIIVVNDGGPENLREMLLALDRKCTIIYARIEQDILWNYNGAVNLGFWLATGDYVAIEDTDHIPDRDLYERAEKFAKENPDIDRIAVTRKVTQIDELKKPLGEWQWSKIWGPNQMVSVIKRDMYMQLKGQDERFGGHYGYMCYCWKNRYNNILKAKTAKIGYYFAIIGDEGEPGLKRGMSPENHLIYRENAVRAHVQHPKGILNFTYHFERWTT